jgi:hypothetical protein
MKKEKSSIELLKKKGTLEAKVGYSRKGIS